jgi:pimeloyl-ACP methyl ester carboxylesterase
MMDGSQGRKPPFSYLSVLLALLLLPATIHAEIVSQKMAGGLVATADYLKGDSDLPAIILLHGFLQTRDFFTVRRLGDSLHEQGRTVLMPNLSLGINNRKQSLSCEAIHTHSMEQDSEEIARWVDWLYRETRQKIYLISHSAGSLQATAYLSSYREAPVRQAIFISLISFGQGPIAHDTPQDKIRAARQLQEGDEALREYPLAYCKQYITTPADYLSYVSWDQETTLDAIRRIKAPISVILGGNDQRLDPKWPVRLQQLGLDIVIIQGANHFFDQQQEFDLFETIERLVGAIKDRPPV